MARSKVVPLVDRYAALLRDEGHVGDLADGGDDGIHAEREFGALDGDGLLPAAPVELAELHPLAGDAADLAVLLRRS